MLTNCKKLQLHANTWEMKAYSGWHRELEVILVLSTCFTEGVCEMSISQLLAGHLVWGAVGH